jgi:hypothetical protein
MAQSQSAVSELLDAFAFDWFSTQSPQNHLGVSLVSGGKSAVTFLYVFDLSTAPKIATLTGPGGFPNGEITGDTNGNGRGEIAVTVEDGRRTVSGAKSTVSTFEWNG